MGFVLPPGRSRASRAPACHRAAHPFALQVPARQGPLGAGRACCERPRPRSPALAPGALPGPDRPQGH
jgi:hypothetical protein